MGSFSTSLSGLDAEEQALSVISNDLSNLNTTAFKTGTPVFSDLFYQMLGYRRGRRPGASGGRRHHEFRRLADDAREYLHHGSTHRRCHPGERTLYLGSGWHADLHPRR